jgi:hypothetical protein
VAARCREVAGRFRGADPVGVTCDLIEGLLPAATRNAAAVPGAV